MPDTIFDVDQPQSTRFEPMGFADLSELIEDHKTQAATDDEDGFDRTIATVLMGSDIGAGLEKIEHPLNRRILDSVQGQNHALSGTGATSFDPTIKNLIGQAKDVTLCIRERGSHSV